MSSGQVEKILPTEGKPARQGAETIEVFGSASVLARARPAQRRVQWQYDLRS